MICFSKIPVAKKFKDKTGGVGVSRFSSENFLSHSSERIHRGMLQCFIIFGYLKKLGISRGRGIKMLGQIFLCHSAEKLRRLTLLW